MEALGILEHCEKWSTSFMKLYTQKLMFKEITAFMFKNSRGCFSYKIINRLIIQCMIYYLQKDKILFHTHSLTHHTHTINFLPPSQSKPPQISHTQKRESLECATNLMSVMPGVDLLLFIRNGLLSIAACVRAAVRCTSWWRSPYEGIPSPCSSSLL